MPNRYTIEQYNDPESHGKRENVILLKYLHDHYFQITFYTDELKRHEEAT